MGAGSHHQIRSFNCASETVWRALHKTAETAGWKVSNGQQYSRLQVRTGMSALCPLGINLDIALEESDPDKTDVAVTAKARGQIVDYGQAEKNTERLLMLLEEQLTLTYSGPNIMPLDVETCSSCGASLRTGKKFCTACGVPTALSATAPTLIPVLSPEEKPVLPVCSQCNNPIKVGAKFCAVCGVSVSAPAATSTVAEKPVIPVCTQCGSPIKVGAKFCMVCGVPVSPAVASFEEKPPTPVCPRCGLSIKVGAKFCAGCGNPLREEPGK